MKNWINSLAQSMTMAFGEEYYGYLHYFKTAGGEHVIDILKLRIAFRIPKKPYRNLSPKHWHKCSACDRLHFN